MRTNAAQGFHKNFANQLPQRGKYVGKIWNTNFDSFGGCIRTLLPL